MDTIKCKAKVAFTEFVSGYGQVHGDPDSSDVKARTPAIPVTIIERLSEAGKIVAPKGFNASDAVDGDMDAPAA